MGERYPLSETRVAYWVERAAAHQCRALLYLQELRGPGRPLLSPSQRGTRQYQALRSLLAARRAVRRAQAMASDSEHRSRLQGHLAQLEALIQAVQQECSRTEARRVADLAY
jgi:hypothetical protein